MNMGYISDTARNRTHNLFRPKREPIPLGHSDGLLILGSIPGVFQANLGQHATILLQTLQSRIEYQIIIYWGWVFGILETIAAIISTVITIIVTPKIKYTLSIITKGAK